MAVANYVNCYLIGQNIREQLFLTSTKKKLNREIGYYLSFEKEKSFCSDAIAHKTYKCYMWKHGIICSGLNEEIKEMRLTKVVIFITDPITCVSPATLFPPHLRS